MTTHVMLDLETYGVNPGCPVLSIGAVVFDDISVLDAFYGVAYAGQTDYGLHAEEQTVKFWSEQSLEARKVFTDPSAVELPELLDKFSAWLPKDALVWGNGAGFDQPILAAAYRATGRAPPWKFFNERCYRTMKSLMPVLPIERAGVHHNALDDAQSQAIHLIRIADKLGLTLS